MQVMSETALLRKPDIKLETLTIPCRLDGIAYDDPPSNEQLLTIKIYQLWCVKLLPIFYEN